MTIYYSEELIEQLRNDLKYVRPSTLGFNGGFVIAHLTRLRLTKNLPGQVADKIEAILNLIIRNSAQRFLSKDRPFMAKTLEEILEVIDPKK